MDVPPPPPPPAYGYPQQGAPQGLGWVPPPPVHRRRWWLWGCGGCGAIAVVAAAVVVFFVIRIFSSSPLRHFPTQAGAATTQDHFQSTPGGVSESLAIVDPHPLSEVETYYQQALHQNGWTTDTRDPTAAASGDTWTIARTDAAGQRGSITFTAAGASTDITVVLSY